MIGRLMQDPDLPGSGRLHSCEVRHDAGSGDASRRGGRPTTAAVFGNGSLALLAATIVVSALIEAAEPKPRRLLSRLMG